MAAGGESPPPPGPPGTPRAPRPPTPPQLGGLNGIHLWTGGRPTDVTFTATTRTVPRSPYCYQLQDPTEAHKALKQKTTFVDGNESEPRKFTRDEKSLTIEQLAEMVADHMEFHGMDSEFYLPDPQDPTRLVDILQEDSEFTPAFVVNHFRTGMGATSPLYDDYSTNNMDLACKAIMSLLDDSVKNSIRPLLPRDLKYGPILWIYVVREVRTASFQQIKALKQQLENHKLRQTAGEDVKVFTTKFLQICVELGKNVPSDAPFLLNEQLCTSSVEQFRVKFMARSTAVNQWVTKVHGLSRATIESRAGEADYISVQQLVEEANAEYTLLLTAKRWGPSGKSDAGNPPEAMMSFTKTEINNLLQKSVSAALKGGTNSGKGKSNSGGRKCHICGSPDHLKKDCPKASTDNNNSGERKSKAPKAPWKSKPPGDGEPETKNVNGMPWHWCAICGFWRLSHGTATHDNDYAKKANQTGGTKPAASLASLKYCGAATILDEDNE